MPLLPERVDHLFRFQGHGRLWLRELLVQRSPELLEGGNLRRPTEEKPSKENRPEGLAPDYALGQRGGGEGRRTAAAPLLGSDAAQLSKPFTDACSFDSTATRVVPAASEMFLCAAAAACFDATASCWSGVTRHPALSSAVRTPEPCGAAPARGGAALPGDDRVAVAALGEVSPEVAGPGASGPPAGEDGSGASEFLEKGLAERVPGPLVSGRGGRGDAAAAGRGDAAAAGEAGAGSASSVSEATIAPAATAAAAAATGPGPPGCALSVTWTSF